MQIEVGIFLKGLIERAMRPLKRCQCHFAEALKWNAHNAPHIFWESVFSFYMNSFTF